MRNETIILKKLSKIPDGLGGYQEDFIDMYFFGKKTLAKNKMVITRANDRDTQHLVNMQILYLSTIFNDVEDLKSITKGDILEISENEKYVVNLVEAYNNKFIVTLLESF